MSRRLRITLIVLGVLVALLVGAVVYAAPLLRTGTGYAAHNACAVELLAGRLGEADQDLPPNPLVPLLSTDVDEVEGRASTSVLGVLFTKTAYHEPGVGCTLAGEPLEVDAPPQVARAQGEEWPDGEQVGDPPSDIDLDAVDAALEEAFQETDVEGIEVGTRAVVVVHAGRIVAERYAEGFGPGVPQLGWSMAKSVTNAMVGRLVAQGELSVDQDQLFEDWTDERAEITLDDLLRMASGLQWDETYALGTTITEMLYDEPDMGAFAASQPLAHDVGTYQQYSSGTTNMICDVLHERTGMGVEMAHELVFQPLGMASAVFEPDAAGDLVCSSYLWATPRDWARFGLWFAQEGEWDGEQLLPEDWVDYSTRTLDIDSEDPSHGAHWWANELADGSLRFPDLPADTFWASGHDGQRVMIMPSADLVVVRMGFTPEIEGDELGIDQWVADLVEAVS